MFPLETLLQTLCDGDEPKRRGNSALGRRADAGHRESAAEPGRGVDRALVVDGWVDVPSAEAVADGFFDVVPCGDEHIGAER